MPTTTDQLTEEQARALIRDKPRQCTCRWDWLRAEHRWALRKMTYGCPRHWEAR